MIAALALVALALAALSVVAPALRGALARRRARALQAGIFAGLGAEIAALAAVPPLPMAATDQGPGRRAAAMADQGLAA